MMKTHTIYIVKILRLTLAMLPLSVTAAAQPDMIIEHYSREEGLPSNTVYGALKDQDGFMWFGTWHGLCSFDGSEFITYTTRPSSTSDVPPQKVRNIVEDKDGYLWIRNTDNHLYMFNKQAETYHDVYNELKRLSRNVQVIQIQRMDNGHVLLLTRNKDLFIACAGSGGKVRVKKIYDSRQDIDPTNMKLRRNVLGETNNCVYWLSQRLIMHVVSKKSSRPLLGKTAAGDIFTCFRHTGRYICAGTSKGRIYIINTDDGSTRRYSIGCKATAISSIDIIGGKIYFTTASGLYILSDGHEPRLIKANTPDIQRSFTDKYGKLWLCSRNGIMTCYDPTTAKQLAFTMPSDSLFAEMKFMDTGANGLFILQRNGEVWHFDHKTGNMQNINRLKEFTDYTAEPHFFNIDIDSNGIIWLSSTTSGVYKLFFPKYNFRFLFSDILETSDFTNETNGIRTIYQSRNGDLWIGTREGVLLCLDARTRTVKRRFGKGEIGVVYHIMEDREGNLWMSTKGSGLVKATYDELAPQGLSLTRYANRRGDRNSISSNRVYYTYQDSHGRIWVCTFYGGLNLMENHGGKVIFRHKGNGLKTYPKYELYTDVRIITEDSHGRLWVGTTDGLMSFDGNFKHPGDITFETYRGKNNSGITSNDISTIYKDHSGHIWMGIFGNGLNRLEYYDRKNRRPVFRHYNVNDKLSGNVIMSITEDKNHCLWIGTENGVASLKQGSLYIKSYDRFAGFPDVIIEDNTSACMHDGTVLIGTRQGLLSFNPETVISENEATYKTFIVDFNVMNRNLEDFTPPIYQGSVKYAEKIVLKHNQATFTIEFASPYYANNNLMSYAYILDGYEEQWHTGNSRTASYSNVPPGHYTFRVKVNDNNSSEQMLEVVILPPWWATWWAYLIYIVLAALVFYGIMRTVMYIIKMRNEVYINDRLAELKIRFFTNVSHELRTPLALIKSPVEELKAHERLTPKGKEYLELIERNSRKMLQLVNQILDFRKIQNGKMKLHVSLVDVNGMIELMMDEFRILASERDITFIFERPDERVTAWCDAEKIGVVLNNLLNNAFKYTDDGGTICITLKHDYRKKTCTICVEDNGAGIPKSQLKLIFERFSQADNKTSADTTYAGTGIGLSLSKEYVNMHNGRIWAENIADGKGVMFYVELPTDKDHFDSKNIEVCFDDSTAGSHADDETAGKRGATAATDITEEEVNGDVPTVMLIEDNSDMCRMLQLQLGESYNVVTAHDGKEGMKKIYRYHPDIIVTDLMMPEMSGLDVLHSVRQDFSISHIPVIILTAKNTEEDKMKAVRAGANAFITKPFSSSYLTARISQLLEEQRIFQRKMVARTAVENSNDDAKDEYERHLVKKDIEFMRRIHEIIEKNLNTNDFNIDTIAGTIGLSRSAFFKKLKSLTGLAPVDLVREIRLNKAARLIETTDDSITEIAYSAGFRDVGYFGKCFRKKYNKTPKEYRKEVRERMKSGE